MFALIKFNKYKVILNIIINIIIIVIHATKRHSKLFFGDKKVKILDFKNRCLCLHFQNVLIQQMKTIVIGRQVNSAI